MRTLYNVIAIFCSLVFGMSSSLADTSERHVAVISATLEAALASIYLASNYTENDPQEFRWSLEFTDSLWTGNMEGFFGEKRMYLKFNGYLWGEPRSDWIIAYSGAGSLGDEPLISHGRALLRFDTEIEDHVQMDVQHLVKFGANSVWGWLTGLEIFVGGSIGAAGAIATTSAATGGLAAGLAVPIGLAGALFGADAVVSISHTVKSLSDASETVQPPSADDRPLPPVENKQLHPEPGTIYTVVSDDG